MNQQSDLDALFEKVLTCIRDSGGRIKVRDIEHEPFDINNPNHVNRLRQKFTDGRANKFPVMPQTRSDSAVIQIAQTWFGINMPSDAIDNLHKKVMAAENFVGWILERYLAARLEPLGWVWLSGNIVQAADFIYFDPLCSWVFVQIKNRDNTENSSSSKIREGTGIIKWFRMFSRNDSFNWDKFPLPDGCNVPLSESDFAGFIEQYLNSDSAWEHRSLYSVPQLNQDL
ncbi:MAG: SinI family restriction endonuclease [Proteobacteria bacterium]|uniref:SinI family restriction endonuclease n=1 Tax=Candidatus Avisuccinivibrio stercorigallinarum TaxID=2840704 RepID=A0A9D9DA23_9GAMM|nr:SinI family restriction endonuclease [Candidatus Avisuccinivibrio stercorigallinarum]